MTEISYINNSVEIKSKKNDTVKYYIKLRDNAKERKESGLFAAEGARLCYDAAITGANIKALFITKEAAEKYREYVEKTAEVAEKTYIIDSFIADFMSDVNNTQGIFCICAKESAYSLDKIEINGKYIAAEKIQDPSNLGAMFRTAEALGISGIIVSGDCCDIYSPKVLRASMGAVLRLSVFIPQNFTETIKTLTASGFLTYASTPSENTESILKCDFSNGCIVVIGNEGNGISEDTKNVCSKLITIPMRGRAESLNASAAAMIIMWEMMRF